MYICIHIHTHVNDFIIIFNIPFSLILSSALRQCATLHQHLQGSLEYACLRPMSPTMLWCWYDIFATTKTLSRLDMLKCVCVSQLLSPVIYL